MQHSLPQSLPVPAHDIAAAEPHVHNRGALDRVGAFLGFACAVHCIAVPLFFGVLPALGLGFLAEHAFDVAIMALASVCAVFAARSGWRAHHDARVVVGFAAAIALLGLGLVVGEETLVGRVPSVVGGFTLAATHILNLRLSKRACAHAH